VRNAAAYPNVVPVRARIRRDAVQRYDASGAASNATSVLQLAAECGVEAFDVVLLRLAPPGQVRVEEHPTRPVRTGGRFAWCSTLTSTGA
jgi:hypothetical protein